MGTSWTDLHKAIYIIESYRGRWRIIKQHWHGQAEELETYNTEEEAKAIQRLLEFSE